MQLSFWRYPVCLEDGYAEIFHSFPSVSREHILKQPLALPALPLIVHKHLIIYQALLQRLSRWYIVLQQQMNKSTCYTLCGERAVVISLINVNVNVFKIVSLKSIIYIYPQCICVETNTYWYHMNRKYVSNLFLLAISRLTCNLVFEMFRSFKR